MRIVLTSLFLVLVPAGAAAQSPTDAAAGRADAAFRRGQAAAAEEDFVGALEAFREAQDLAPHDAVRFNVGLCLERLGRYGEAIAEFDHAAGSQQLTAEQRSDAGERASRARARLAHVRISGSTPGARVSVDGAERCTSPCELDLDPGQHRVSAEGAAAGRAIVLRPGQQLDVAFEPAAEARPPGGPTERQRPGAGLRVGPLGWVGAGLAVAGAVSTSIFGLRVLSLKSDYLADPTQERLEAGELAVTITNVSLVVTVLAAALFAVDVLILEHGRAETVQRPDDPRVALTF